MTEPKWKVEVDSGRLTISSDDFTFTTRGSDPADVELAVADLQSAVRGTYGQYCGLSHAAEIVGERWGFLIVRDLLVGPRSVADLCGGLPGASVRLVTRRLTELAHSGVVRAVDGTGADPRYELTEYGRAIEDAVLAFGRWGAVALAMPRPDDVVTHSSLIVALKATFRPDVASGVRMSCELRVGGHVLGVRVDDGALDVTAGPLPGADAVLDLGYVLLALMNGEMTAADVLATGQARVDGDPALLHRFAAMFRLPDVPAPAVPA